MNHPYFTLSESVRLYFVNVWGRNNNNFLRKKTQS